MVYEFPVSIGQLEFAARLLGINLRATGNNDFSAREFVDALKSASPPALEVKVSKKRSQYSFDRGWVEIAQVSFPATHVQSLSIHSNERDAVEEMLDLLEPGPELEVMNYVEACRRWGSK
jgi:hypothetical protein